MLKNREDKDLMRQFPRRPRFGVRLPSILKLEFRWFNRYHLLNLTVYTRIAKQIYNRTLKTLNVASTPCSLIQGESSPSIVVDRPPFPVPLLYNPQFFKPSARLISTTTNRTRILPFNITESATRLTKTSSSQSPSLSWKLMKNSSKNPKHKPVLEDKTLTVLFKKKAVTRFNPNRIPQSGLRTLSPLTNLKALQKWLCVVDVLWDVEDENDESWTPISLFLVSLNTWNQFDKCWLIQVVNCYI